MLLRLVEALYAVTQLGPSPSGRVLGFEDAGAEKFRDVLELVGGKAEKKLAGFTPLRVGGHRAEGLHQNGLHRR
jgi:hypothetical protein